MEGLLLRPRCIRPKRARTQYYSILFYSTLLLQNWDYPNQRSLKQFLMITWNHTSSYRMHICFQMIVLYSNCMSTYKSPMV